MRRKQLTWISALLISFSLTPLFAGDETDSRQYRLPPGEPKEPIVHRRVISRDNPDYTTEVFILYGSEPGPTVAILAGAHGDEPAGTEALLQFLISSSLRRGTLVAIPRQNPLALSRGLRTSEPPAHNSFYNFARAYPVGPLHGYVRETMIRFLQGRLPYAWWWLEGDDILTRRGVIPREVRYPGGIRPLGNWVDDEGYRRALAPEIRRAGGEIFDILKEFSPDYVLDMHESRYSFKSSVCVDDQASLGEIQRTLSPLNQRMRAEGLPDIRINYVPTPTSLTWASAFALESPARGFTLESDAGLSWEKRLAQHREFLWFFLEEWDMEPRRVPPTRAFSQEIAD